MDRFLDAELNLARCTMGNEVNCTVTQGGKSSTGRALLETSEIIFRGRDVRFKIPFSSISEARAAPPRIFFAAESREDLGDVKRVARSVRGAAVLWIVYPKGQKDISEADVRSAGLASGLTDIKVTSFSSSHTALKFVVPKAKR